MNAPKQQAGGNTLQHKAVVVCSYRQVPERRQQMCLIGGMAGLSTGSGPLSLFSGKGTVLFVIIRIPIVIIIITHRKRDPLHPQLDAVAHLPTPPHALEVTFGMLAVECDPDLERLAAAYSARQAVKAAALSKAQVRSFAFVLHT